MKTSQILLLSLLLFACQNNSNTIKRGGEPDIVQINEHDRAMNKAIDDANYTLKTFDDALASNDTSLTDLALKVRFDKPTGGSEHIWLTDVVKKDEQYSGVIGNVPQSVNEVKLGDTILIPKTRISDWMYIQNGKLKGGYTIRILRDQLSEADKIAFDRENGFVVE